jgi:hypothetical protein
VGEAYKQIILDWRDVLPTQSVCLNVPIVPPSLYGEAWAVNQRESMRVHRREKIAKMNRSDDGS